MVLEIRWQGGGCDATNGDLNVDTVNKVTVTPPATGATLTIADGATLTASATATVSNTNTGDQTSVTGNAGTATALQTARNINGVSFDGTANITVPAAGSTLTDTVPVSKGGTGNTTCVQGDLLYGSAVDTISKLAKDANATRYLANTGASNNPAWSQVNLANGVSGALLAANANENLIWLSANQTGSDVNTQQPFFPTGGSFTAEVNTVYSFEGCIRVSRSAGTTSHTTNFDIAGTATKAMQASVVCSTGDDLGSGNVASHILLTTGDGQFKSASTSATEAFIVWIRGSLSVSVAGTLIPGFKYSAAPGGAPLIRTNSWFSFRKIGATGADIKIGAWA